MADKCVVDDFGGKPHPYAYCVKPIEQMMDIAKIRRQSGAYNLVGVSEGAGALFNYTSALILNPANAMANECKGVLGSRYLLKTKLKCTNGETLHKYINNVEDYNIFTQRRENNLGILPSAIASASKINGAGLIKAIYDDPVPECKKVRVPCHIVDTTGIDSYTGVSNPVYITTTDYNKLVERGIIDNNGNARFLDGVENFNNLYEDISKYVKENPFLIKNYENKTTNENIKNDFNEDVLINLYLIIFCLFIIFIIGKIIIKK